MPKLLRATSTIIMQHEEEKGIFCHSKKTFLYSLLETFLKKELLKLQTKGKEVWIHQSLHGL